MASGAFLVSRDIFENPIWTNPTEFRLFFLILGKATFADEGVNIGNVHVGKGQWIRSYRNLQSDLEYIENNAVKRPGLATVKRTIDKLIKDGRILAEPCELGTLFTVVNYCKYQALDTYKNKAWNTAGNSSGTAAEQQRNNNNNANKDNNAEKDIYNTPPLFSQGETEKPKTPTEAPFKSKKQEDMFVKFWDEYPKKVAKRDAEKAWSKIPLDDLLFKRIMAGLERARGSPNWIKENGQYIPHPATWLNGKRWEDEHEQQQREEEKDFGFHKV